METTLNNLQNLLAIHKSMQNIKEIDRSDNFNNYFNELQWRIQSEKQLLSLQLDSEKKLSETFSLADAFKVIDDIYTK